MLSVMFSYRIAVKYPANPCNTQFCSTEKITVSYLELSIMASKTVTNVQRLKQNVKITAEYFIYTNTCIRMFECKKWFWVCYVIFILKVYHVRSFKMSQHMFVFVS